MTQLNQSQRAEMMVSHQMQTELEAIATLVRKVAQQHQDQNLSLLALLRLLEALHQEIRDGFFQKTLPDNRQALYNLLKDIEAAGGWPYIHRMRLQDFLANLAPNASTEDLSASDTPRE